MAHDVRNPHIFVDGVGAIASGDQVMDNFDALWTALDPAYVAWHNEVWGGAGLPAAIVTAAATYLLWAGAPANAASQNTPGAPGSAVSGMAQFYMDPADWTVSGRTTKLRLRVQYIVNAVNPAITLTAGLYPVTAFGGASGNNPTVATIGAVVAGSTVAVSPGAASNNVGLSSEFNPPAAGGYVLAVAASGAMGVGAAVDAWAHLQRHYV